MTMERNGWEQLQDWIPDWLKASLGGDYTALMERPEYAGIREKLGLTDTPSMEPEGDPSFQYHNELMGWLQQLSPEEQARVIRDPNSQMFHTAPPGREWKYIYNAESKLEEWTLVESEKEKGQNQYSIEQMGGWDVQVMRDASGNIIDMQPLDQTPTGAGGGEGWSPYEQVKPGIEQGYLDLERQKMGQMTAYQQAQMGVQQQELGLKERQWQTGLRAQPSSWIEAWFAENQPGQNGDVDMSGNPDYQQYLQETGGGQAGGTQLPQAGSIPGNLEATEGGWRVPQTGEPTKYGDTGGYMDYIPPEMQGYRPDMITAQLQKTGAPSWTQAASVWRHPEAMSSITMPQIAGGIAGTAGAYQGIEGISAKLKAGIPLTNEERILYSQTFEGIETAGKPKPVTQTQPVLSTASKQRSWAEDYLKKNPFNI